MLCIPTTNRRLLAKSSTDTENSFAREQWKKKLGENFINGRMSFVRFQNTIWTLNIPKRMEIHHQNGMEHTVRFKLDKSKGVNNSENSRNIHIMNAESILYFISPPCALSKNYPHSIRKFGTNWKWIDNRLP